MTQSHTPVLLLTWNESCQRRDRYSITQIRSNWESHPLIREDCPVFSLAELKIREWYRFTSKLNPFTKKEWYRQEFLDIVSVYLRFPNLVPGRKRAPAFHRRFGGGFIYSGKSCLFFARLEGQTTHRHTNADTLLVSFTERVIDYFCGRYSEIWALSPWLSSKGSHPQSLCEQQRLLLRWPHSRCS